MPKISVFIPAYNEENRLKENIVKLYNHLKRMKYPFELFIIDDNSTDSTPIVGTGLAKRYNELRFTRYDIGPSRRENLAKSFSLAKGDIIVFMDADLSTNLKHTNKLIELVEKGYDIVTGSRHIKGAIVDRSLSRSIISKLYKYFVKLYFGSKINDHQCGFKAFKRNVILGLVNEMGYDRKFRRKFFWDAKMLIRGQKEGYKIKEIPMQWKEDEKSVVWFYNELRMIPYMLNLRFRL